MKDLTQGAIPKHLIDMAVPIAIGMFVQTLYLLVDLYFVGQIGEFALAGVSAAANASFIVIAFTQILNVGTATLIAHAVGRKDRADANLIFNQASFLALALGGLTLVLGYVGAGWYMQLLASDPEVKAAGVTYLYWFLPNMALQFAVVAMAAALRGTGIVKPAMLVQMLTVVLNIILAPILIGGWGTGIPMGVAGAGLASSLSLLIGVVILIWYFVSLEHYVAIDFSQWRPQLLSFKRLMSIGFPAGAEFLLMFVYMAVIYWAIQGFGAAAQAGFGLGSRIMQALLLPALALAFAAPAIAGQNFGAKQTQRVKDTFKWTVILSTMVMSLLTLLCLWQGEHLIRVFSSDIEVVAVASVFLSLICFNFVPSSIVFSCSGMFQGLGNTWPGLISSAMRILTFALPALWLSQQSGFYIEQLWYLSIVTVAAQCVFSLLLLRGQFNSRLKGFTLLVKN